MDKQTLLLQVKMALAGNIINKNDLIALLNLPLEKPKKADNHTFNFAKIFAIIGGIILTFGLLSFGSLIWPYLGFAGHLMITFGIGVLCFVIGTIFIQTGSKTTGLAFHIVSPFLLIPGLGLYINQILGSSPTSLVLLSILTFVALVYFGIYLLADLFLHSEFFTFAAWITGGAFYWLMIAYLIEITKFPINLLFENRIFANFGWLYCILVAGVLYAIENDKTKQIFSPIVSFFVSCFFLINTFWFLWNNPILEILFGFILISSIYFATIIKKSSVLVSTIIGLLFYLNYLTFRYFANFIAWPVAIILVGLIFVGCGYVFSKLNSQSR
jgi:hypothetical protein